MAQPLPIDYAHPTPVVTLAPPIDLNSARVEAYFAARSLAPNTGKAYRRDIQRFQDWCKLERGGVTLAWGDVSPRIAGKYKQHLEEANYKPASINRFLAPLTDLYRWMIRAYPEQRLVNPWDSIDYIPVPQPLPQDLSEEQVTALWEVLADRPLRDAILFALLSHGLRLSEVAALKLGDYDGEKILIAEAKADSTGHVWLTPGACKLIEAGMDGRRDEDPIVWSEKSGRKGQPLSAIGIQSIVQKIGDLAGIPSLNPHRFRHAAAVNMLRQGLTPEQVATILRHKSINSTRRYTAAIRQESAGQAFLKNVGEVVNPATKSGLQPAPHNTHRQSAKSPPHPQTSTPQRSDRPAPD